jgi:HAD superfamily hydrolase (TIGR01509 family)
MTAGSSWAALFDWDGVIVDSRALHEQAWNAVAREFGYRHAAGDFKRHFGSQNRRAIIEILGWTRDDALMRRISERKEELYRDSLGASAELLLPGVSEFLALLGERGVPCAIVSSSPRINIDRVLGGLGLGTQFQQIVAAEDAARSKPDPEGFIRGASRLGVQPTRCVVFEDAPAGIEAGRRAEMRVVALTTTHAGGDLGAADIVVDGLRPELVERIESWFDGTSARALDDTQNG